MRDLLIAALGGIIGAVIGFLGSLFLWWRDRSQQQHIARMVVATDLRLWIDRTLAQMYEMRNYESTEGNIGTLYSNLSKLPFEESLERVAKVDPITAMKIFKLIRKKNNANDEINFENDVVGGEEAVELWRYRCAQVWLRALVLYESLSKKLGWSEQIVADVNKVMMKKEVDDFLERKRKQAKLNAKLLSDF